jgi:hypothetical protein
MTSTLPKRFSIPLNATKAMGHAPDFMKSVRNADAVANVAQHQTVTWRQGVLRETAAGTPLTVIRLSSARGKRLRQPAAVP